VVDQDGREVTARNAGFLSRGPLPDEATSQIFVAWPHPVPHRLSLIEGEVTLFRKMVPVTVEVPMPLAGQLGELRSWGSIQGRVHGKQVLEGNLSVNLAFDHPHITMVEPATRNEAVAIMPDGSERPILALRSGGGSGISHLRLRNVPGTAQGLRLTLLAKWSPDERHEFRFQDYPAVIGPAPQPQEGAAP
jgi:hypothetical protein